MDFFLLELEDNSVVLIELFTSSYKFNLVLMKI